MSFYQAPSTEDENWAQPILRIEGQEHLVCQPLVSFLPDAIDLWVGMKMIPVQFPSLSFYEGDSSEGFFKEIECSSKEHFTLWKNGHVISSYEFNRIQWTQSITYPHFSQMTAKPGEVYPLGLKWQRDDAVMKEFYLVGAYKKLVVSNGKEKSLSQKIIDGALTLELSFNVQHDLTEEKDGKADEQKTKTAKEKFVFSSVRYVFLEENGDEKFAKITFALKDKN